MELSALLTPDNRPIAGIEHEFIVWNGQERLDFRDHIHGLRLGKANLDPGDPFAYRLPSGC